VSCTHTSILADGAAGYFVFKAGIGRFGAQKGERGRFGFSGLRLRGLLWSREEREGVFLRVGWRVGWEGGAPGGRQAFPVCEGGAAVRWQSRFYSLLLRVAVGFTPVFNTFVRFHKFDSVNDGRKSWAEAILALILYIYIYY
jgi:hypothetical protein